MKLRKLEIIGFKSFADKASFKFGDGITGIVGPNGCGKSNVVDAIRWCMGEISAKHLRGRAMQDIIFAGSDKRGPLAMAEVTLTFENHQHLTFKSGAKPPPLTAAALAAEEPALNHLETPAIAHDDTPALERENLPTADGEESTSANHSLISPEPTTTPEDTSTPTNAAPMPAYAAYSEIAVTRRLYRDGTSVYLINKVPVRLRDITDLFLGTGVGIDAYSIIEQGRIGMIINARPEDRRHLLEEVAGITKFKARKKAAERRLELTGQNLARVEDITLELAKQLSSLKRQAQKALRYKQTKEKIKDLELHQATLDWLRLHALEKVTEAECLTLAQNLETLQTTVATDETTLATARLALVEQEQNLHALEQLSNTLNTQLAGLEKDLVYTQEQLKQTTAKQKAAENELQETAKKLDNTAQELLHIQQELTQYTDKADDHQEDLSQSLSIVASKEQEVRDLQQRLMSLRKAALEETQRASREKTVLNNLQRTRQDLLKRLEHHEAEKQHLSTLRNEHLQKLNELTDEQARSEEQLQADRLQLSELKQSLPLLEQTKRTTEQALNALKDNLRAKSSRLTSLQEVSRRLEGYSEGVRSLFGIDPKNNGKTPPKHPTPNLPTAVLPGIRGLASDILEVPEHLEKALEAALGERLQYLLIDNLETGKQAISYLQKAKSGRSGFIIDTHLETLNLPPPPPLGELQADGILGYALELLKVKPAEEKIAASLLRGVVIAEDLDAAAKLLSRAPHALQDTLQDLLVVTLNGEVLTANGCLLGGATVGSSASLLMHQRESRVLEAEVQNLTQQLETTTQELSQLQKNHEELTSKLRTLEKNIHTQELRELACKKDRESLNNEILRTTKREEALDKDYAWQQQQLNQLATEEINVGNLARKAEENLSEIQDLVKTAEEQQDILTKDLNSVKEKLTNLKIERATREEKLASLKSNETRLGHLQTELLAKQAQATEILQQSSAQIQQLALDSENYALKISTVGSEAHLKQLIVNEERAKYEAENLRLAASENSLRAERQDNATKQKAYLEVKMELQKIALAKEQWQKRIDEKYDLNLLQIAGDYHLRPLFTNEDQQKLLDLERSLKNMGPINLAAIEECEAVETRYNFLSNQKEDLVAALDLLKKAIWRINKVSRERFKDAFHAVNNMFQKVYPRLFKGGRARLELTTEEDLLEAGIEIIAEPPGKKLQSVNLLSGGEKALTATALIFAIFLIKPSPFCVLDEVDAPLDEANVSRFNDMLREISKVSQFIVISHNKQTMLEADKLYGVTMEEPGMSKVVAVDLNRLQNERAA